MSESPRILRNAATMSTGGAVAAVIGWCTLLVVARVDDAAAYASFAVVWSVYYATAGVLGGLQQETTRSVLTHIRTAAPDGVRDAAGGPSLVTAGTGFGLAAGMLVVGTFPLWRDHVDGGWPVAVLVAVSTLPLSGLLLVLGVLAAEGRWGAASGLLVADAVVRLLGAAAVASSDAGAGWYAAAIASGSLVWVPVLIGRREAVRALLLRKGEPGVLGRMAAAVASTSGASLLIAGMPWLYAVASRQGDELLSAGLLAALVLFRSPVIVLAQGVRPVVLRHLVAQEQPATQHVRRAVAVYLLVAVALAPPAWLVGPWALQLAFGDDFVVSRATATVLVVSAVLLALGGHLTTAAIARSRHLAASTAWAGALVVSVAVLALPGGAEQRLLPAAVLGPVIAVAHLALVLTLEGERNDRRTSGSPRL